MKVQDRLRGVTTHANERYKQTGEHEYPSAIHELIIYHKIRLHLEDRKSTEQSFRRLKTNFVDWNEVRISSIPEIQEALGQAASSLSVSVFIKDFLDFIHGQNQTVDLEYLGEENLTEIRRFLRQIKGIDPATISMVLHLRKEYPVLPVSPSMEPSLIRMGLVRTKDNRDQKGRYLHSVVEEKSLLPFHHFLVHHSQETCPPDEDNVQCKVCSLTKFCQYYEKVGKRKKKASARGAKAATKKTAAGSTKKSSKKSAKAAPKKTAKKTPKATKKSPKKAAAKKSVKKTKGASRSAAKKKTTARKTKGKASK